MHNLQSIGIFGGTFDPIHNGHLRAAIEILEQLQLDEMRLLPCKQPHHRGPTQANAAERQMMSLLAVEGTKLVIDDREMHREGPSYSIDTLTSLRKTYPTASLCMVIGTDAFLTLPTWHQWEKLIQLANIIVINRNEQTIPHNSAMAEFQMAHALAANENIKDFSSGKVLLCSIPTLDISSSRIRTLMNEGRSPQFLIPEKVFDFITQRSLYQRR